MIYSSLFIFSQFLNVPSARSGVIGQGVGVQIDFGICVNPHLHFIGLIAFCNVDLL
jgi:hypothetical protein